MDLSERVEDTPSISKRKSRWDVCLFLFRLLSFEIKNYFAIYSQMTPVDTPGGDYCYFRILFNTRNYYY